MEPVISLPIHGDVLRTPDARFANLPDFPYQPHYTEVGILRIAHIDEGPRDGPLVLLMHGEPAWSFLYRKMIPVFVAAGMRVIVPDLVGFGRSDKLEDAADYSYFNHVQWMKAWVQAHDFQHITFFGQDWGSLVGLRVVAEMPDRFDRVVLANGGLSAIATKALGGALAPTSAAVGDVVLFMHNARETLGICNGQTILGPGALGLVAVPMDHAIAAWRVL